MPKFTDHPADGPRGVTLPLRRTPPGGTLTGSITCEAIVGTNTHWYGGRTVPCELPNCEACSKAVGWRWHGYLSAIDGKTAEHFLFEFTAQSHEYFRLYLLHNANLRGCEFKATRLGKKANGKVVIQTKRPENGYIYLPDPPDITQVLCHIWGIEPERAIDAVYVSEHRNNEVRHTTQIQSEV